MQQQVIQQQINNLIRSANSYVGTPRRVSNFFTSKSTVAIRNNVASALVDNLNKLKDFLYPLSDNRPAQMGRQDFTNHDKSGGEDDILFSIYYNFLQVINKAETLKDSSGVGSIVRPLIDKVNNIYASLISLSKINELVSFIRNMNKGLHVTESTLQFRDGSDTGLVTAIVALDVNEIEHLGKIEGRVESKLSNIDDGMVNLYAHIVLGNGERFRSPVAYLAKLVDTLVSREGIQTRVDAENNSSRGEWVKIDLEQQDLDIINDEAGSNIMSNIGSSSSSSIFSEPSTEGCGDVEMCVKSPKLAILPS